MANDFLAPIPQYLHNLARIVRSFHAMQFARSITFHRIPHILHECSMTSRMGHIQVCVVCQLGTLSSNHHSPEERPYTIWSTPLPFASTQDGHIQPLWDNAIKCGLTGLIGTSWPLPLLHWAWLHPRQLQMASETRRPLPAHSWCQTPGTP